MCPNCHNPYCKGTCQTGEGSGGGEVSPGEDGSTPDVSRVQLINIVTDPNIRALLLSENISIIKVDTIETMQVGIKRQEGLYVGAYILYNAGFFDCYNGKGQQVMVLHEFTHILLAQQNKPWSNSDLINSEDYRWRLEDIFGQQSDEFYDMMRWAGCTKSPEFFALPFEDRQRIGRFLEDTLEKQN